MHRFFTALVLIVLALTPNLSAAPASVGETESGLAAIYSNRLNGHRTASGQIYSRSKLTAAHQELPFGTRIRVTNVHNHKSVVLVVNDRGPVQSGRILDISPAAASQLGIHKKGLTQVTLEVLKMGSGKTSHPA